MKANRKFLNNDDEAVSPVIAVILMVAITVVLAATVYVWVSGFGSNSSQPAKSMALTSAGQISNDCDGNGQTTDWCKQYTVASASPGMKYSDISVALAGTPFTFASNCAGAAANSTFAACAGTVARAATALVSAGDTIYFRSGTTPSAQTLQILDGASNSIMLTLTVS